MEAKRQILESVPLLATLGEEALCGLVDQAEFVTLKKDELAVREGEKGDGFYVVVSGRLQAYTQLDGRAERIYVRYGSGDWFGETPLLSGETHWASVRALNDSVLLKIPRAAFEAMLGRDPRMALGFTQRMGERMTQLREEKNRAKWSTIIALCSAVPGAGKTLLATNLVASLAWETGEPVLMLDFSGRQGGKPLVRCKPMVVLNGRELEEMVTHHPLGYDRLNLKLTGDEKEIHLIAPLFGDLIKRYKYVLVDLPNETCPSVLECMIQSDHIYVVAKNEEEHLAKTRVLLRDLKEHRHSVSPKARVILTAVGSTCVPYVEHAQHRVGQEIGYLLRWIPESEIIESVDGVPYVLRKPMEPYSRVVRRIAREMGNLLVGLVLGAGGARGLAHIGVIRVLEREGITVDVVAGSSMGALVAAAWASGRTADELEKIAMQVKGKRIFLKLLNPMFPGAGIVRGLSVYHFLDSILDGLTFEDTMIPVKIVACDLHTMEEVVFEQGKVIDAIRASISIPGIFRPMKYQGRTLIDGGLASPVPVDLMVRSGVSKIIAVNTFPNPEAMKQYRHAEEESRMDSSELREPMHETGTLIDTPTSLIKNYMRFLNATQARVAQDACSKVDVVISPTVPDGFWYDFYNPERYIRRGEQVAEAALPQLRELVGTRKKS
ncbi:MAG: patatin-like phospholipase family protein [Methylacidiphilales bacterium]|nr:patatin-like phospholipase family protein [Candidatus Methylacidiphilales bacterium]